MKELASKHQEKLIDLLTARLQYERAGVKLYDKVIEKVEAKGTDEEKKMLGQLREHRNEEKEHEEWLEEQIRALGGDAHGRTSMSNLEETEASGVEKVILKEDHPIPHMIHGLLTAELGDNAGWELLVKLAEQAGDDDAKKAFEKRLKEEQDHLQLVRKAVARFAEKQVLGERVSMPTSP